MKYTLSALCTAMLLLLASSCSEYPCVNTNLSYQFVVFQEDDVDIIVLKKFSINSTDVIDSTIFDEHNPIRFSRQADTLKPVAYAGPAMLSSDYELILPRASIPFKITDINQPPTFEKSKWLGNTKEQCTNTIVSCKVNG